MDHVIQSFTQPLLFLSRLDPTARAILRLDKQLLPRISSRVPGRPLSRTLTYCLRPFFWFTLIKETKVKDHVKWRIPLGAQWVVSACLAPAPLSLNDTALVKRITKERGWLRVPVMAPGQLLSLVYYLPRIWELVFFVQQRLNAAGFLSQKAPSENLIYSCSVKVRRYKKYLTISRVSSHKIPSKRRNWQSAETSCLGKTEWGMRSRGCYLQQNVWSQLVFVVFLFKG